jgi:ferredoxin
LKQSIIYYFSGSGNSLFIAEQTQKELEKKGYTSTLINIEENNIDNNHTQADLLGFIFPIYGFGLPEIAVRFLNNLPKSKKQKTFLFTIPAGHEGIGIIQGTSLLKIKGYEVINARSVYMPDTWIAVMNAPPDDKLQKKCLENTKKIENYVDEILSEKKSFKIANPIALLGLGLIYFIFTLLGRHQSGKAFCSSEKCTQCKVCYNSCPSGIIKWKNDRPYWTWNCQQCFRCINTCPSAAVEISNIALIVPLINGVSAFPLYNLLPLKYKASLSFIHPIPEILLYLLIAFLTLWGIQVLLHARALPPLYLTKTRKRYNFFKDKFKNLKK